MFQKEILSAPAFGIVGEFAFDGPTRVQPAMLKTTDETNNVIGRAFTVKSGGTGAKGDASDPKPIIAEAGGTGAFAGILIHPKSHAAFGSDLAPTSVVKNGVAVELLTFGNVIVEAPSAVAIGDKVYFDPTTGILSFAGASAVAPTGKTLIPNASVIRFSSTDASLAVISLNS